MLPRCVTSFNVSVLYIVYIGGGSVVFKMLIFVSRQYFSYQNKKVKLQIFCF